MTGRHAHWRVSCQKQIGYQIIAAPDLFNPQSDRLLSFGRVEAARRFVVVDSNVERLYSNRIRAYFEQRGVDAKIVTFPGGEECKSLESYLAILRELDAFPIHRRDEPIIAIGGGVLTDIVGFVASSYRRGLPHIKVPTTLMGYVDASLGIKTGINFNGHKNRLGSFEPPLAVFLDRRFLESLPLRHIHNGVCEIVKLAVIKDATLFGMLEMHGSRSIAARFQDEPAELLLERAITSMLEELQPNLFEEHLARKVDFGHSFSYGLETCYEADLLHGEAVLLDIAISVLIAHMRGLLSSDEIDRIFDLIAALGLKLDVQKLDADVLWSSLQERTYHRNGLQRLPLPAGIGGCVFVNDIVCSEIQSAVTALHEKLAVH